MQSANLVRDFLMVVLFEISRLHTVHLERTNLEKKTHITAYTQIILFYTELSSSSFNGFGHVLRHDICGGWLPTAGRIQHNLVHDIFSAKPSDFATAVRRCHDIGAGSEHGPETAEHDRLSAKAFDDAAYIASTPPTAAAAAAAAAAATTTAAAAAAAATTTAPICASICDK